MVGCNEADPQQQLECLKELPTETLTQAMPKVQWGNNVDGIILKEQPGVLIAEGKYAKIPLVFGNCKDENSYFICPTFPNGFNETQYEQGVTQIIQGLYPQDAGNITELVQLILQRFPSKNYENPEQAYIDVSNLLEWFCPMQRDMEIVASNGIKHNTFAFQYVLELIPGWSNPCLKVAHSFDLPFVFPLLAQAFAPGYQFTDDELKLSEFMLTSWTWFTYFGSPGDSWMPSGYPKNSWNYTVLDKQISTTGRFRLDDCQWWWKVSGSK